LPFGRTPIFFPKAFFDYLDGYALSLVRRRRRVVQARGCGDTSWQRAGEESRRGSVKSITTVQAVATPRLRNGCESQAASSALTISAYPYPADYKRERRYPR